MKKNETPEEKIKRMKAIYARLFYQEMLLREEWEDDETSELKKDISPDGSDSVQGLGIH
jgi:hypothetical protein